MGVFDRAEKRIGAAVDKVFARAFKGDVQPVEIAAGIQRELDSEAKLLSRDKRLVPNVFTVSLSPHDYNRLFPYTKTLNAEIIPGLREHAAERSYVFSGPIQILYMLEQSLPTGQFRIASQAIASAPDQPPAPRPRASQQLVLEVGGVRHPLVPPGLVIGRGSSADLRVNDPGVSRPLENRTIRIEDLGSTNGIVVDGSRVQTAQLRDGSRIEIGNTRMLVHSPSEA